MEKNGSDNEYDVVEGLSTWEFINPSDDDDDVDCAFSSSSSEVAENDHADDVVGSKEDVSGPFDPNSTGSLSESLDFQMKSLHSVLSLVDATGSGRFDPYSTGLPSGSRLNTLNSVLIGSGLLDSYSTGSSSESSDSSGFALDDVIESDPLNPYSIGSDPGSPDIPMNSLNSVFAFGDVSRSGGSGGSGSFDAYSTGSPSESPELPTKPLHSVLAVTDVVWPVVIGPGRGTVDYDVAPEDYEYGSDQDEDEEQDYEDEYDLDDELVPNGVRGRIGRDRIKKLGKRGGYSRMKKSKKLPYYYNRPGCVYGKHGLGVQHSYI